MNTGDLLTNAARSYGSHPAFIFEERVRTYAEANARADALAHALVAAGVGPGDRVALSMRNCPEFLEAMFGVWKLGGVIVPLNAGFTPDELAWHLDDCGAVVALVDDISRETLIPLRPGLPALRRVVCCGAGGEGADATLADELAPYEGQAFASVHTGRDDLAWIAYTSGTTGRPKGAMLSHGNMNHQCLTTLADVERMEQHHVGMHSAPLSHGSGHNALVFTMKACTQVIHRSWGFDPALWLQQVERYRVAAVFLVPTQIKMIVDHPDTPGRDLSSLEWIIYGGAPMYREDQIRALKTLGNCLVQIYGQTETPMAGTVLTRDEHSIDDGDGRERSVGRVRVGIELKILDDKDTEVPPGTPGQICVRGETVMLGYWNRPDATAETLANGWLHTGDVGSMDANGYVFILDRLKDLIISGGLNVYPIEIEDVLLEHPDVSEACVVGVPDEKWGEAVRAVVVRVAGSALTAEDLIAFARQRLAGYKTPKAVDFVDAVPKTAYGKVDKKAVRAPYWAGLGRVL
jgi:long-chain acyl-CoA synthetase